MDRRAFLIGGSLLPFVANRAAAYPALTYEPATYRDILASTERLVINFRANWSITCQMKSEIIAKLLEENADYGTLTFMDVDWDTFGPSEWVERRLKVKRRSTLVAFVNGEEIARLENKPFERSLRNFLDQAIA